MKHKKREHVRILVLMDSQNSRSSLCDKDLGPVTVEIVNGADEPFTISPSEGDSLRIVHVRRLTGVDLERSREQHRIRRQYPANRLVTVSGVFEGIPFKICGYLRWVLGDIYATMDCDGAQEV